MSFPTEASRALATALVRAMRADRARLRFEGPDRAASLHNLTTNEVRRRAPGDGCEAFVTSPQGKTLGLASLLVLDDAILLRTAAGGLSPIAAHLNKYAALDDVEIADVSDATFEHHLAGPSCDALLDALGVAAPAGELDHCPATIAGVAVRLIRESPLGVPGVTILGDAGDAGTIADAIGERGAALGLVDLTPEVFDALRVEAGTPESGRDVTEANLPQELDRDDRAISFVKGCYLGQETVARIDALGHVNRHFRGLSIDDDRVPMPGSTLWADGKEVGRITSTARSERTGRPIALGFIRTAKARPGTDLILRSTDGLELPASVSAFPITPPG